MKTAITIVCICIIVAFAMFYGCLYSCGKSLAEVYEPEKDPETTFFSDNIEGIEKTTCDSIILLDIDRVSKDTIKKSAAPIIIDQVVSKYSKVNIGFIKGKRHLVIALIAESVGCFSDYAEVYLIMRDGSNLQFNSNERFNCGGRASIFFELPSKEAKNLLNYDIIGISIRDEKTKIDADFDEYDRARFFRSLSCFLN